MPCVTLTEVATLVRQASEHFGHCRRRGRPRLPDDHPLLEQLRVIQDLRHATTNKPLAYFYSAAAHMVKRRMSGALFNLRCEEALKTNRSLPPRRRNRSWKRKLRRRDGTLAEDQGELCEIAAAFYEDLYRSRTGACHAWWYRRWGWEDIGTRLDRLTPYRLRELVHKFQKRKDVQ